MNTEKNLARLAALLSEAYEEVEAYHRLWLNAVKNECAKTLPPETAKEEKTECSGDARHG